tara:strand:+ start:210 stop:1133 length:924 start_codon:yes stop_codon:yes gene_type:complete
MVNNDYYEGKVSFFDLVEICLKSKLLILFVTSLFGIFSIFFTLSLDDIYTSSSTLEVKQESNKKSASSMSALTSLTGISLGSDNKSIYISQILKSRDFTKHIISFENVLKNIFAVESYDKKSGKILYDESIYDEKNSKWVREPNKNQKIIPSYLEAHHELHKNILSFKEIESGFIEISIEHQSPVFADELLELIIEEINNIIRQKDISDSKASLDYLYSELKKTNQIEIKQTISELIKPKLEMLMLADINDYYSVEPIDAPYTPEQRSWPNRALICILITFVGFILISSYVLIMHMFFQEYQSETKY